MNTSVVIIVLSLIIIFSYLLTFVTSKIKIPSVVILILLGIGIKFFLEAFKISIPELNNIISILGTIGLILIVLEASLEIEICNSNKLVFGKAFISAFFIILAGSILTYLAFGLLLGLEGKNTLLACIALSIISSAIVIPSIVNLGGSKKLFLTLEAAFADVIGVVIFNFVENSEKITLGYIGGYLVQIVLMMVVAVFSVLLLGLIMKQNTTKIRYFIILAVILLIYGIGKYFHLSTLIIVLLFGVTLANFDKIKALISIPWFKNIELKNEIIKFEEMNNEISFVVRTFFFIIFGMSMNLGVFKDLHTLIIGLLILAIVYLSRILVLFPVLKKNIFESVFAAPRGLITILLFYQIHLTSAESIMFNYMSIVVLGSILVMTVIILFSKNKEPESYR